MARLKNVLFASSRLTKVRPRPDRDRRDLRAVVFWEKLDNHRVVLMLYFVHYYFCRQHRTLRDSPAMQAGLTDELLSMASLCAIMDAAPAKKRGTYKRVAA
jgi:hypothetical protein